MSTTQTRDDLPSKDVILSMLTRFVNQRPALDFANYGDARAYRSESRAITGDLHDFNALAAACGWRSVDIAPHLDGGRLTLDGEGSAWTLDYCTGQYFPTEYRKAACRALASALWAYWRESAGDGATGHDIRRTARRELGARLARRYFA